ncbi:MAG: hypothetical protein GC190_16580 [Alphaproteobacteria bacterium]|nr:hypothetical protein [Alphaproteobacteria bacterium]
MLQFELTADDYVAANDLNTRWTRARWLRVVLMSVALIGLAIWKVPHDPQRALVMVGLYLSALTVLLLAYRYAYLPWRARHVFAQTKALQRPYTWDWNDDQLNYKTDLATGIVPWTNLGTWRENESLFALYASPIAFFLLPKRAFADDAAIEAFRATLRKKVAAVPPPEASF